jgi:hypothetical protein
MVGDPLEYPSNEDLELTVTELRERIGSAAPSPRPIPVRVRGVFSPAVLLNSGWWERPRSGSMAGKHWGNNIQRWTYAGFNEWGPSWDFTGDPEGKVPYFLGQLGEQDEVNSILVVVVKEGSQRINRGVNSLLADRKTLAYSAVVRGLLCHRSHFDRRDPELSGIVDKRLSNDFSYCLLLNSDEHDIIPAGGDPDYYSGYLWQCLWAIDRASDKDMPILEDCYIIWEHTDLTKSDVIEYNLDGLRHKMDFLGREDGELEVLQKSSRLVDGVPRLSYAEFRRFLGEPQGQS